MSGAAWRTVWTWIQELPRKTRRATPHAEPSLLAPAADPGMVWIDAQGLIRVKNPGPQGKTYAVLEVPEDSPITVWVNDQAVKGLQVVTEQDAIRYTLHEQPPVHDWTIEVDESGLTADVVVHYAPGWRARLRPCSPCSHLVLHPEQIPWEPEDIPVAAIETELNQRHIVEGRLPESELIAFLQQRQSGRLPVARGIPPQPGEPAPIAWTVGTGSVDDSPVRVAAGTVLGRLLPAQPGKLGRTVFGTSITPPERLPSVPEWGPGVLRTETGDLVAQYAGRVRRTPTVLDVIPETVLTPSTDAPGVVVVNGDAALVGTWRHATILATGRVRSTEPVDHCVIRAQEGLDLTGPVTHTQLFVGPGVLEDHFRGLMEQILQDVASLERTMQALQAHAPVTVRLHYGALLVQVLHDKFPTVPSALDVAQRLLTVVDVPVMIRDTLATLTRLTSEAALRQYTEFTELRACQARMDEALALWTPTSCANAVPPSELGRLRDCIVRGAGTLEMIAAEACEIDGVDVLRVRDSIVGGFCRVLHRVQAHQLGNPRGTETVVQTLESTGIVEVDHLYPGTVIVVGSQRHFIRSVLQHVVVDGDPEQVEML
ncbi:flagellar assembly protein A [Sulfobacillus thermosulfidooxidans]|uniref:flagellar assembly protein A n=1 Tax=Sulfobacillus thermosulfidooxidans TaxID=28034 RepID=UPI0006B5907F|nr:flagellar assembly protein A [Sulfobacillus thermosulfidooxidans]